MEAAPAGFSFYEAFTIFKTPYHQDVEAGSGLIRQERGFSRAEKEGWGEATGFILFAAIYSKSRTGAKEKMDRACFGSGASSGKPVD